MPRAGEDPLESRQVDPAHPQARFTTEWTRAVRPHSGGSNVENFEAPTIRRRRPSLPKPAAQMEFSMSLPDGFRFVGLPRFCLAELRLGGWSITQGSKKLSLGLQRAGGCSGRVRHQAGGGGGRTGFG